MGIEIERKYLVKGEFKKYALKKKYIKQGFLNSNPLRTVRVRLLDEIGFITVKGIGDASGLKRFEWEKQLTKDDAIALLKLCEEGIIEKVRYYIPRENEKFIEVDEFYGENEGLILAEIELADENEKPALPSWIGEEVTGNVNYYNSHLSKVPYKNW